MTYRTDPIWTVIMRCASCAEIFDVTVQMPEVVSIADDAECDHCGFLPNELPENSRIGRRHTIVKLRPSL
jgi:hypothetical protein